MSPSPEPTPGLQTQTCSHCHFSFLPSTDGPAPGMAGAITLAPADEAPPPSERDTLLAPAPALSEESPQHIGRFHVEAFLGEGAFGRVYRAFDPSLKRTVALKVARAEQLSAPG